MAFATIEFKVGGMSCRHCEKAIKDSVGRLPGISTVDVNLDTGQVRVSYEPQESTPADIRAAIDEAGYKVEE